MTDESDGAVAENTYGINWHLPLENEYKAVVGPNYEEWSGAVGNYVTLYAMPFDVTHTEPQKHAWWTIAEGDTGILASGMALWASQPQVSTVAGIALTAANFAIQQTAPPAPQSRTDKFEYKHYCAAMDAQVEKDNELQSSDLVVSAAAARRPNFFPTDRLADALASRNAATSVDNHTYAINNRAMLEGCFV